MEAVRAIQMIDQLLALKRGHDQLCKSLLAEYNLRASEMTVLAYLAMHPECRTAQEISEAQFIGKSLVSMSLDSLVSRGLVQRRSDTSDRRRMILTVQPAAGEIIQRLNALTSQYLSSVFSDVAAEDLLAVERVFRQISHNMNNATETA